MGADAGRTTRIVSLAYALVSLLATWPLAARIRSDLPGEMTDPLLNCWILAWNAARMSAVAAGDPGALGGYWHGNIFHPEPLTLTFSEHLFPQSLQALPIYLATRDILLSYNLLLLSTFALSALAAYLLVRELTGSAAGAFVAGLVYGFAPYRVDQLSHLQVLSSQWMPLTLLGLSRFARTGRRLPLVAAAAALAVQVLSCGYYLLFFPPLAAAFAVFELARRGRLAEGRAWGSLAAAGLAVAAVTAPFVIPYSQAHQAGLVVRDLREIEAFSADLLSYVTAPYALTLWGPHLDALPRREANLFPTFTALALAGIGLIASLRSSARAAGERPATGTCNAQNPIARARRLLGRWSVTPEAFFAASAVAGVLLSFGPTVRSGGSELGPGPYRLLLEHVPGFDAARVPTRVTMIVTLCLAVLAGRGAAGVAARGGATATMLVAMLFAVEAAAVPLPAGRTEMAAALKPPPHPTAPASGIYDSVAALSDDAVLVELPFGSPPWEVHYMLRSTRHWRRLLNGHSGYWPASYRSRRRVLGRLLADPDAAWRELSRSAATHAVVHGGAWGIARRRERVEAWLKSHGAERVATAGLDSLFALPRER